VIRYGCLDITTASAINTSCQIPDINYNLANLKNGLTGHIYCCNSNNCNSALSSFIKIKLNKTLLSVMIIFSLF
jgi:hypothetical protein